MASADEEKRNYLFFQLIADAWEAKGYGFIKKGGLNQLNTFYLNYGNNNDSIFHIHLVDGPQKNGIAIQAFERTINFEKPNEKIKDHLSIYTDIYDEFMRSNDPNYTADHIADKIWELSGYDQLRSGNIGSKEILNEILSKVPQSFSTYIHMSDVRPKHILHNSNPHLNSLARSVSRDSESLQKYGRKPQAPRLRSKYLGIKHNTRFKTKLVRLNSSSGSHHSNSNSSIRSRSSKNGSHSSKPSSNPTGISSIKEEEMNTKGGSINIKNHSLHKNIKKYKKTNTKRKLSKHKKLSNNKKHSNHKKYSKTHKNNKSSSKHKTKKHL